MNHAKPQGWSYSAGERGRNRLGAEVAERFVAMTAERQHTHACDDCLGHRLLSAGSKPYPASSLPSLS